MTNEEALNAITAFVENYACGSDLDGLREAIEALKEKRPQGKWIWKEYDPDYDCGDIVCSKCSVVIYEGVSQARLKVVKWPFCPDCGADMRKEGDSN